MATTPPVAASTPKAIPTAVLVQLAGVLLAGAMGGLLYWVLAKFTGTSLPTVFGNWTALILMFIGAMAGAFGVFLLTASDPTAIRTYIFAAVCGLAWQPIITAAQQLVVNKTVTDQDSKMSDQVQQIQAANSSGNVQQITTAAQNTVQAVNNALSLSPSVTDPAKKVEIEDSSRKAINELQTSAATVPTASVDGLKKISLAASNSGESNVALRAIQSLDVIGSNATTQKNAQVAHTVHDALLDLAHNAHDSSVQKQAQTAAAKFFEH